MSKVPRYYVPGDKKKEEKKSKQLQSVFAYNHFVFLLLFPSPPFNRAIQSPGFLLLLSAFPTKKTFTQSLGREPSFLPTFFPLPPLSPPELISPHCLLLLFLFARRKEVGRRPACCFLEGALLVGGGKPERGRRWISQTRWDFHIRSPSLSPLPSAQFTRPACSVQFRAAFSLSSSHLIPSIPSRSSTSPLSLLTHPHFHSPCTCWPRTKT